MHSDTDKTERDVKIKSYPKQYYASKEDCKKSWLRKCSPRKAKRHGVFGWRSWTKLKKKS